MLGHWRHEEDGQAIVLVGALGLGLLAAMGLALDSALLYIERRAAQDAADAAAIAGAVVMRQEGDLDDVRRAAGDDAARNGFASEVTVTYPPDAGPHAGDLLYVEVVIATRARAGLLPGPRALTVRAVGTIATRERPPAIWASGGPKKKDTAIEVTGGSTVTVSGSDLIVAATSTTAVKVGDDSRIVVLPPNVIEVVGGVQGANFDPQPKKVPRVVPDPFAGYEKPPVTGVPVQSCCGSTLEPGIYPDGIDKLPAGTVTMRAGTYILKGKGLSVDSNTTLVGDDVFIYLTDRDYPFAKKEDQQRQCGDVQVRGELRLTAAATGPYMGMAIYEDPRCKKTAIDVDRGTLTITGAVYLPTAELSVKKGNATLTSTLVVHTLVADDGATLTVRFDPIRAAPARGEPRLAD